MSAVRPIILALLTAAVASAQAPPAKRPLKHSDYDIWNRSDGVTLSADGKWLAYAITPAEGDGTIFIKSLTGGPEHKLARGGRPPAETPTPGQPPTPRAGNLTGSPTFTPDGTKVLFPLPPTRAEVEKARADRKEAPRTVLAVFDLNSGKVVERIEQVRSYAVHGEGTGYLVYQKEAKPESPVPAAVAGALVGGASVPPAPPVQAQPTGGQPPFGGGGRTGGGRPGGGQFGGGRFGGQGPGGAAGGIPTLPTRQYGSEIVVRTLADGKERTFADVSDFSVTKDAKLLVYTVASKKEDTNGVYAVQLDSQAGPFPLKQGKGRYTRWTWDEKQTRAVFLFDENAKPETASTSSTSGTGNSGSTTVTPTPATPAKWQVYFCVRESELPDRMTQIKAKMAEPDSLGLVKWSGPGEKARVTDFRVIRLLDSTTPGLKPGHQITDRGTVSFSADGLKLTVGVAPEPKAPATSTTPTRPTVGGSTEERIDLDLWHWKDELIQPMQKVRGDGERTRSFNAVYFFDTKQLRQLSDENVQVTVPDFGDYATHSTDKPYRYMTGYGENPSDYAVVNIRTGEKKDVLRAHIGLVTPSPKYKYLAVFDGKDWSTVSTADGKKTNLTAKLKEKFFNEEHDTPNTPGSHGITGWTADEKFLLVSDKFDIWKLAADGSSVTNLTQVGRGSQIKFRVIRFTDSRDEPFRGYDLSKPLLLSAENLHTRDTGFYRLPANGKPQLLVMGARDYGTPVKARNADTLLMTVSTFADFPDYYATDLNFKEIRRVTDINPRTKEFNWGKAELVHYKSADGVPLSGMLIKPEDFDPAKKYPMIVYIYERLSQGLHTHKLPAAGTSINATYYASNGYLVFMPDIAYTVGSPGQSAMKCVLPAIQAVVDQHGCVDEANIGIQGHSWGGYQIAYMVTQTNRFKAAEAGAPVSNMVSAYGGIRWGTGLPREFQYEKTQSRIGATLWQTPMKYIENSPIFMADRVQTPLMILHNDQDDAVPWYQGIEYYLALRRLGKECYLFNYNGEFHGLRKKATQRDYTLRMQQFFDHHLKGAPAPEWMKTGIKFADRDKEKDQWKGAFKPEGK